MILRSVYVAAVVASLPVVRVSTKKLNLGLSLKVVSNEKEGGPGRWQIIGIGLGPRRSRFFAF